MPHTHHTSHSTISENLKITIDLYKNARARARTHARTHTKYTKFFQRFVNSINFEIL